MIRIQLATAAAIALIITGGAAAQSFAPSAFYVGAGGGRAQHAINGGNINQQLIDLGFTGAKTSTSDEETAWKISGGWQPWPNLGVEVSYFDLGKPGFTSNGNSVGMFSAKVKVTGWSLDLVPQYQWSNGFGVLGRFGYAHTESKADFSGTGVFQLLQTSSKESKNNWDAGAGVSYAFNNNFSLRAEWTYYPDVGGDTIGGKYHVNVYGLTGVWRF